MSISLYPSARGKFFLKAPELSRHANEATDMAGVSSKSRKQHHNLTAAVLSREEKTIEKLLATINGFTDPFLKPGTELFNLVMKVVMPENIKEDMCYKIEIGRNLLHTFVEERIKSEKVNLWSALKRRKL